MDNCACWSKIVSLRTSCERTKKIAKENDTPEAHLEESRGGKEDDDLGTVASTVPMSSMSKLAPLDPAQFSLSRHGHPVQNGEIFFVSMSLGVTEY